MLWWCTYFEFYWGSIIREARSHTNQRAKRLTRSDQWRQVRAGLGQSTDGLQDLVASSGQASGAHRPLPSLPSASPLGVWRTPQPCRHTTCYNIHVAALALSVSHSAHTYSSLIPSQITYGTLLPEWNGNGVFNRLLTRLLSTLSTSVFKDLSLESTHSF